jgi:N-acylneuraminate cytidylyltransferase
MYVVIPARGGSKGIPGKNIKKLNGKPLIQYTIEAAREVFDDDKIIVSTDSAEIKKVVEGLGLEVPFLRPAELARDNAGTYEVLLHANKFMEQRGVMANHVMVLQPTSPFRTGNHIREAIDQYSGELEMLVSVRETSSNPYYVLWEDDKDGFLERSKKGTFVTRQECPRVWEFNGAIYIIKIEALKNQKFGEFKKIRKYVMDEVSSHDIDSPLDWKIAEAIIKEK